MGELWLYLGVVIGIGGMVLILREAVHSGNLPAVVNVLLSLAAVSVPLAIEFLGPWLGGGRIPIGPVLPLWMAVVGLIHSYGMLGPYDRIWWWDHLSHLLAASLIAALVYASLLVVADHGIVGLDDAGIVRLVVIVTFAAGLLWELVEYLARWIERRHDISPVLVVYGPRDTLLDLVVDLVGAVLVVILDIRVFVPVAAISPHMTATVFAASVAVAAIAFVLTIVAIARMSLAR